MYESSGSAVSDTLNSDINNSHATANSSSNSRSSHDLNLNLLTEVLGLNWHVVIKPITVGHLGKDTGQLSTK